MTDRISRRNSATSLGANDPRQRATGFTISGGLRMNEQGEIVLALDPRGPLFITPRGELALRVGAGLSAVPGSRVVLGVTADDSTIRLTGAGELVATRPAVAQVVGLTDALATKLTGTKGGVIADLDRAATLADVITWANAVMAELRTSGVIGV